MLYEIISPDQFLRPYIDYYRKAAQMYLVVRNAFATRIMVDKEFQWKTMKLIKKNVSMENLQGGAEICELDDKTIESIKASKKPDNVRVINLVKSIEQIADRESTDLMLISMSQRAQNVRDNYEDRIISTEEALDQLKKMLDEIKEKKEKQREKGIDSLTFFFSTKLSEYKFPDPDSTAKKFKNIFNQYPNWNRSEKEVRELRAALYGILLSELDDLDKANEIIDDILNTIMLANAN
jgi:type I restriction enzyme R subunit